jgi:hypothetical protein
MKFSRLAAMAALPAASAKIYFKEQFNDEASQSKLLGSFDGRARRRRSVVVVSASDADPTLRF